MTLQHKKTKYLWGRRVGKRRMERNIVLASHILNVINININAGN